MKVAKATPALLSIIALFAFVAALASGQWAGGHSDSLLLPLFPAVAAYTFVVWGLARLIELDFRRTLIGATHMLFVPVIAALALLAILVDAVEKHASSADAQPRWGVLIAQATQHGLTALRTAVAA